MTRDTNPLSPTQRRQDYEMEHRPQYDPQVDDIITVELPDERTRATIIKVISPRRIIAQLNHFTTANKSHNFKKGDFIPAQYRRGPMNLNGWYIIPQNELEETDTLEEPQPREMMSGDL